MKTKLKWLILVVSALPNSVFAMNALIPFECRTALAKAGSPAELYTAVEDQKVRILRILEQDLAKDGLLRSQPYHWAIVELVSSHNGKWNKAKPAEIFANRNQAASDIWQLLSIQFDTSHFHRASLDEVHHE